MGRVTRSALARLCDVLAATIVVAAIAWAGANLAVSASGDRLFVVTGGSMEPSVPRGSLIVVHPLEGPPGIGDTVTVLGERGAYVTHRVMRVARLGGAMHLELQGDANATADPVLAPVSAVVGRVELVVPYAGRIQLVLARPSGWMVLLGGVVMLWLAGGLLRPSALVPDPPRVLRRPAIRARRIARWPS